MPKEAVVALERCKRAFVAKSPELVEREIQDFYLYHDDMIQFRRKQQVFEDSIMELELKREAFVAEDMSRFDRMVRIEVEDEDWSWSPFFMEMRCLPQPASLCRPFEHSEDEFKGILKWMEMEGKRIGDVNEAPHMARALKLFARSEVGARMPMLCLVGGLSMDTIMARPQQILFAMEELIRVGKLYFPNMDIEGPDFEVFRCVLDQADD